MNWPTTRTALSGPMHTLTDGTCYSVLFTDEHQTQLLHTLGNTPSQAFTRSFAEKHRDWVDVGGHYIVKIQRPTGYRTNHFLLHVERSNQHESAMTAWEVFDVAPPNSWFGLDTSALPGTQAVTAAARTAPSGMYINPVGYPTQPTFTLLLRLRSGSKQSLDLTTNDVLNTALMLFESARIQAIHMDIFLDTGKTILLHMAVTTSRAPPDDLSFAPIYVRAGGNDMQPVEKTWDMPENAFGQEIRALNLGNPPPQFHFKLSGGSGTGYIATIRMQITLLLGGYGILPAIDCTDTKLPTPATLGATQILPGTAPAQ